MRAPVGLLVALLATGCMKEADPRGFGGGGTTSGGDDSGDTGPVGDAPWIDELSAEFTVYSGRKVLEVAAYYTDADDDLEGGKVHLDVTVDGEPWAMDPLPIDGSSARVDSGEDGAGPSVRFTLGGQDGASIDTTVTYTLDVTLEDAAGNLSNTASATVDPL